MNKLNYKKTRKYYQIDDKNIIYLPDLSINTLTNAKITTPNIFKKCSFKIINNKSN